MYTRYIIRESLLVGTLFINLFLLNLKCIADVYYVLHWIFHWVMIFNDHTSTITIAGPKY